jgi:hypothetical protein
MTRIIIDDVEDIEDLTNAIAVVMRVFTNGAAYAEEEQYFSKRGHAEPQPVAEIASPVPYVRCAYRGTHLRLTECWACWCDVYRGAALETEVLAVEAWDVAVGELLAGPTGSCDDSGEMAES